MLIPIIGFIYCILKDFYYHESYLFEDDLFKIRGKETFLGYLIILISAIIQGLIIHYIIFEIHNIF